MQLIHLLSLLTLCVDSEEDMSMTLEPTPSTVTLIPSVAAGPSPTIAQSTLKPLPQPTLFPTSNPSTKPSPQPTISVPPSPAPSSTPTNQPTFCPSSLPTPTPTTSNPSSQPTFSPTSIPTSEPSFQPTISPHPTSVPSSTPTLQPTFCPTFLPTPAPTTSSPSSQPSSSPTSVPTAMPSSQPTISPQPTFVPSSTPSARPTLSPSTSSPSSPPSFQPTVSFEPTSVPSSQPSFQPTVTPLPTLPPTSRPSPQPSLQPTFQPTFQPTLTHLPTMISEKQEKSKKSKSITAGMIAVIAVCGLLVLALALAGLITSSRRGQERNIQENQAMMESGFYIEKPVYRYADVIDRFRELFQDIERIQKRLLIHLYSNLNDCGVGRTWSLEPKFMAPVIGTLLCICHIEISNRLDEMPDKELIEFMADYAVDKPLTSLVDRIGLASALSGNIENESTMTGLGEFYKLNWSEYTESILKLRQPTKPLLYQYTSDFVEILQLVASVQLRISLYQKAQRARDVTQYRFDWNPADNNIGAVMSYYDSKSADLYPQSIKPNSTDKVIVLFPPAHFDTWATKTIVTLYTQCDVDVDTAVTNNHSILQVRSSLICNRHHHIMIKICIRRPLRLCSPQPTRRTSLS